VPVRSLDVPPPWLEYCPTLVMSVPAMKPAVLKMPSSRRCLSTTSWRFARVSDPK